MRILAFETSAKAVSAALVEDGNLIGEYYQNSGQTHSRTLMQLAEDLLRNCDLTPADVDAVACAAGPGSSPGAGKCPASASPLWRPWSGARPGPTESTAPPWTPAAARSTRRCFR